MDFAIVSAKLVIEIDGGIHQREDVQIRDVERQCAIEAEGWRFLRIDSETAMSGDHVWALVAAELGL